MTKRLDEIEERWRAAAAREQYPGAGFDPPADFAEDIAHLLAIADVAREVLVALDALADEIGSLGDAEDRLRDLLAKEDT